MKNKLTLLLATAVLLISTATNAAPIYTQTPQGSYTSNVLTGSVWNTFTGMVQSQNTINQHADFENYATLSSYNAIWVDQELSSTLSGNEVSNLQTFFNSADTEVLVILDSNWNDDTYISHQSNNQFALNIADWLADTSTQKMVLIGENSSWSSWNQSIMDVVGGGHDNKCSWTVGSSISSHVLTTGVNAVENACGSTISLDLTLGNPDILFDNNMAAIYRSGAPMPEPALLLLLGLGLAGAGFSNRKRK